MNFAVRITVQGKILTVDKLKIIQSHQLRIKLTY